MEEEEMEVAVVYESLFGNTRLVAEAIADGIRTADPAANVSVMRTGATKLGEVGAAGLLSAGRQLRRRGYGLASKPESFIVTGSEGPLRQGELDRAREWGAILARHAGVPARS